jgi:hypothetical protein
MKTINEPIQPEIELDGGYAYCPICYHRDLKPGEHNCVNCGQLIDWSWMKKYGEQE